MAVVPTRWILTPAFDDTKRMTVQGAAAAYESVAVTVVGVAVAGVVPAGLVMRVVSQCERIEYARFPAVDGDAWTGSGSDATCTLNLNTTAIQRLFARLCGDATCEMHVKLENGGTNNLYGTGYTVLRNWVQNPLDPVVDATQLQAEIDTLASRIAEHQHDGSTDSAAFPHNNLTGREVAGVHPTIEGDIGNLQISVQTNANAIATQKGRLDDLATAVDPGSLITALNADDDLVKTSDVWDAVRALIAWVNTVKGAM